MKILGVIPARGGSKGVPRKNIYPILGKPLIAYTIEAALNCSLINDLVVSSEDNEIRNIAIQFGAKAPFIRPKDLATDLSLAIPTIQHAVVEMETINSIKYDVVIMLQPTAPLRTSDDLTQSIHMLLNSDADSVISIVNVDNWHPMKMKKFNNGLLEDYEKPPMENPPRQILPDVYINNGAIYATMRDVLMNENSFKGKKCLGYEMPQEKSVNIDNMIDIISAEYYLNFNK